MEGTRLNYPAFCRKTATAFVQHHVATADPDRFTGACSARNLGGLGVADIASADHAVERTRADIAHSASDHYKVSLQISGTAQLAQDGHRTVLHPGDFVIYDTAHPYRIRFPDRYRSVVLMLPKATLEVRPGDLAALIGHRLRGTGANGCFTALLGELGSNLGMFDDHEGHALAESAVHLLGISLRHELGAQTRPTDADAALRRRVLEYIDARLATPSLDPGQIAEAHHLSVSRLHALFRNSGLTVASYIRGKRLSACHRALTDPRQDDRTITQIAHAHGFSDSAHFSRLYRSRYGVSPRETRRARS